MILVLNVLLAPIKKQKETGRAQNVQREKLHQQDLPLPALARVPLKQMVMAIVAPKDKSFVMAVV